ncbi:MAG: rhodanese-like domain-containing protein [Phycisphaerales bacterium]
MMLRHCGSVGSRRVRCLAVPLAAVLFSITGCEKSTTDASIHTISVAEARVLLEQRTKDQRVVLLVDPRAPQDFEAGHIPLAVNLRLKEVPSTSSPDKRYTGYETIVVYGEDPGSASAAAMTKRLIGVGYESVRLLVGGLAEWAAQGGEVAKGR